MSVLTKLDLLADIQFIDYWDAEFLLDDWDVDSSLPDWDIDVWSSDWNSEFLLDGWDIDYWFGNRDTLS